MDKKGIVTAFLLAAEFKMSLIDCPYAESDTDNIPQTAIPKIQFFFIFIYSYSCLYVTKTQIKRGTDKHPFIYRSVKKD